MRGGGGRGTLRALSRARLSNRLTIEASIEALHVHEDALPIGVRPHLHHVVNIQQWRDASPLPVTMTTRTFKSHYNPITQQL